VNARTLQVISCPANLTSTSIKRLSEAICSLLKGEDEMFEPATAALSREVYDILTTDEKAILLDCRATSEWDKDGIPDLSAIGKNAIFVELLRSDGTLNQQFLSEVSEKITLDTPVFVLCKSGIRSAKACEFLMQAGFESTCNITGGWEAYPEGWVAAGLPWVRS
jgi:rhodanese-related sulfurtransferase